MVKNDIRPYEISLWTLQDSFITVLKPIGLSNRGQIETPKCRTKNDGTQELNFSIPMYYRENGVLIENPIWYNTRNGNLLANMRKIKLIFNKTENEEAVFEFIITKIEETIEDALISNVFEFKKYEQYKTSMYFGQKIGQEKEAVKEQIKEVYTRLTALFKRVNANISTESEEREKAVLAKEHLSLLFNVVKAFDEC